MLCGVVLCCAVLCYGVLHRYTLFVTMAGMVYGTLTYQQLFLFSVMCWPYNLRPFHLAKQISLLRAEELAAAVQPLWSQPPLSTAAAAAAAATASGGAAASPAPV